MSPDTERRLLQIAVGAACRVPLLAGGQGVIESAAMAGAAEPVPINLDSHYRYLSGLLLGIGLGFLFCIPAIERRTLLFRALGLIVVVGGLSRLLAAAQSGLPGAGHSFGLVMELAVVPALMLWQVRVARRYQRVPTS